MLVETLVLCVVGFEIGRRPWLKKKAIKLGKKLPGVSAQVFEKGVSSVSSYLINAWPDLKRILKGDLK
jgi:hypothetical protein